MLISSADLNQDIWFGRPKRASWNELYAKMEASREIQAFGTLLCEQLVGLLLVLSKNYLLPQIPQSHLNSSRIYLTKDCGLSGEHFISCYRAMFIPTGSFKFSTDLYIKLPSNRDGNSRMRVEYSRTWFLEGCDQHLVGIGKAESDGKQ